MTTRIPPTEYNQILQTNLSPETIAALLNEAEERNSVSQKYWNTVRIYPFWKVCKICQKPYPADNAAKVRKNITCSRECQSKHISQSKLGKVTGLKAERVVVFCGYCGKELLIRKAMRKYSKENFCSYTCRAKKHANHLLQFCANGKGKKCPSKGMKMEKNPAWKGGVTYFKTHGNYANVKYIRCPAEYLPMARKDGYVMEHRLIVAQVMGRLLKRTEVVHHTNHDPTDNRLENLMLFASNQQHKSYEGRGTPEPLWRP